VHGDSDGAVVVDSELPSGAVIGGPDPELLARTLAGHPADLELIVQAEDLDHVRSALPDWSATMATVHDPPVERWKWASAGGDVSVEAPAGSETLADLAAGELAKEALPWAEHAAAVGVVRVAGRLVSVCQAIAVTETLWDVGIDTVEAARRRGHGAAGFAALADHMARRGRRPVWSAADDNPESMALARKLGFEPVAPLAVLLPPSGG
jgi:RimJ/RimL family protein N-acetyltransferase